MLINLLKPSLTPHSNAFLSYVKLPFIDSELNIPVGQNSMRKISPKRKEIQPLNFLQRINIQDQYKQIKINNKNSIQSQTSQKFYINFSLNNHSSNIKRKNELNRIKEIDKEKSVQALNTIQRNLILTQNLSSIKNQTENTKKRSSSKLEEIREIYLKQQRSKFSKTKFKL